jgi:hypothetical protein
MTVKIQVVLDTTADPEVVVIPEVATANAHDKIQWTQIQNEGFTFGKLEPQNTSIHDPDYGGGTVMTAGYDAKPKSSVHYKITVYDNVNNQPHTTDPKSRKGETRGGPVGNGGGPTIKNN